MILINADDYGRNHLVNLAIVEAFQKNYINNTTIMVNMPGFTEAVELSETESFKHRVGLHVNLFDGEPLTTDICNEPLFFNQKTGMMDSKQFFHQAPKWMWFVLPMHTRRAIKNEVEAQVQRYLDAGFTEMHFDSHGHSHTFFSVYSAIRTIMKKRGFVSSRKSMNLYDKRKLSIAKRLYKKCYNTILKFDFNTTDFFCDIDSFDEYKFKHSDHSFEIMVHPVYQDNQLVNAGRGPFLKTIKNYCVRQNT